MVDNPAAAILAGCDSLNRASGVPAHFASHQLRSAVFVAIPTSSTGSSRRRLRSRAPWSATRSTVSTRRRYPLLPGWSRAEPCNGVLGVASSCTARFRRRLGLNARRRPHLLLPISGPDFVEPTDPPLKSAPTRAFSEPAARRAARRRRSSLYAMVGSWPSVMPRFRRRYASDRLVDDQVHHQRDGRGPGTPTKVDDRLGLRRLLRGLIRVTHGARSRSTTSCG
jgi:hypothetical protein